MRARITDAGVGAGGSGHIAGSANFQSPSGGQNLHAVFSEEDVCRAPPNNGVYEYAMTVPQGAEGGTRPHHLWLYDQLGNMRFLNTAALQAAGYPTSFTNSDAGDTVAPQTTIDGGPSGRPRRSRV